MSFKILASMVVIMAMAANGDDGYAPHHTKHHKDVPMPYSFAYGIKDEYAGLNHGHQAESDGKQVAGSYTVDLPDGRQQKVTYKADHYGGYNAEVSYYGEAQYPGPSKYPPFTVKPAHGGYKAPHAPVHAPKYAPPPKYH